jgi:hypothetical protein
MGIIDRVVFAPPPGSDPADSVAHSDGDRDPSATLPPELKVIVSFDKVDSF